MTAATELKKKVPTFNNGMEVGSRLSFDVWNIQQFDVRYLYRFDV